MRIRSRTYKPAKVSKRGAKPIVSPILPSTFLKTHPIAQKKQVQTSTQFSRALHANDKPITRLARLASSRSAVFDTFELLEQILLYLPCKTILTCQRISTTFRTLIADSRPIQTLLMLRPSRSSPQTWTFDWIRHQNTYLPPPSPLRLFTSAGKPPAMRNSKPILLMPVRLNPLLRLRWGEDLSNSAIRFQHQSSEELKFTKLPNTSISASWEKMYISSPAATAAMVELRFSLQGAVPGCPNRTWEVGHVHLHKRKVENPQGLTLGDLIRRPLEAEEGGVDWQIHGRYYCHDQKPGKRIAYLEKRHNVQAVLNVKHHMTSVTVEGIVVSTEEEWRTVRQ